MKNINLVLKIVLIQMLFCFIILISLTVIEFVDKKEFNNFLEEYFNIAHFDTNISLVYEGE